MSEHVLYRVVRSDKQHVDIKRMIGVVLDAEIDLVARRDDVDRNFIYGFRSVRAVALKIETGL